MPRQLQGTLWKGLNGHGVGPKAQRTQIFGAGCCGGLVPASRLINWPRFLRVCCRQLSLQCYKVKHLNHVAAGRVKRCACLDVQHQKVSSTTEHNSEAAESTRHKSRRVLNQMRPCSQKDFVAKKLPKRYYYIMLYYFWCQM